MIKVTQATLWLSEIPSSNNVLKSVSDSQGPFFCASGRNCSLWSHDFVLCTMTPPTQRGTLTLWLAHLPCSTGVLSLNSNQDAICMELMCSTCKRPSTWGRLHQDPRWASAWMADPCLLHLCTAQPALIYGWLYVFGPPVHLHPSAIQSAGRMGNRSPSICF